MTPDTPNPPTTDEASLAVTADDSGVKALKSAAPEVVDVGVGQRDAAAPAAPAGPPADAPEVAPEMGAEAFDALMERATSEVESYEPGDKVSGVVEVISLHGQEVFLDLGGRATGYILKEELLDDEGNLTVAQGDTVEGVVVGTDFNGIRIRRSLARAGGDIRALRDAYAAGIPVEGKVTGTNKGGYDVLVAGTRAFCPHSQIDLHRPEDPEAFVGQTLTFRVTELKGREAVVSRAVLMREQQAEKAAELRDTLTPGARLEGRVRSIQPFGVFVDLGGLDGLIHVSELSWGRKVEANEIVSLGQQVEVVVLGVDDKRDRISLSLKQAEGDPFETAIEGLGVGSTVDGTVARLTNFGAFVTIASGVDGLVHISDLAHHHVRHPREILSVGDAVQVRVTEIDLERRRLGLSLKALADDPWDGIEARYALAQEVTGKVQSIQDFGVFVELEPGVTALLPASESGIPQGQSLHTGYKKGAEVTAKVLRVDADSHKMALTVREDASYGGEDRGGRGGDRGGPRGGGRRDDRRGGPGGGRRRDSDGPRSWIDRGTPDKGDEPLGSFGALLMAALDKDDDKK